MSQRVLLALLVMSQVISPAAVWGQRPVELAFTGPQPHFVAAWAPKAVREAERSAVLARRVSLELSDVPLDLALQTLIRQAGLNITYSPAVLPPGRRVTVKARDIAVVTALTEMLFRSGLDVWVDRDGTLALVVCRHPAPRAEVQDSGTIVGVVTDKATGAPIAGAMVGIDGSGSSAIANGKGQYRIERVDAGSHTVQARYIGYLAQARTIAVGGGEEIATDFALVKSVQRLNEVVVTGTIVPTELRAVPSPMSIITADDIERQSPRTMSQAIRQAVPSAVAWDLGADPEQTVTSIRGASTLDLGSGTVKVYLDGIEITDRSFAAIDPTTIERIEVLRGPQAAAIYGSDAIAGVIQVFSKKGSTQLDRPQTNARAAVGVVQSPYGNSSGALRQEYTASVQGGAQLMSYSIGGAYTRTGDWVPEGGSSTPSGYGGVHVTQGPLSVDFSGRYYVQNVGSVLDPRLALTGFPGIGTLNHRRSSVQEHTYGGRLTYTPVPRWQHNLTVGVDRFGIDLRQVSPQLTTPDDTLLLVNQSNASKTSVAYNTSLQLWPGSALAATLTAGVDHYLYRSNGYFAFSAFNTVGSIRTPPGSPPSASRNVVTNTGYFAQAQVSIRDALFLTGGVRAEDNSDFGAALGTPVSPRVGASYAHQFPSVNLKLRGSYGEAIRPPSPGQKDALVSGDVTYLASPGLGPERQKGWDAGLDLSFAEWGSLSATYYHQIAQDLIQVVLLDPTSTPQIQQYQNVGRIRNSGVELEGMVRVAPAELRLQYAYARSRVLELGPTYTGDLRVGEQVFLTPRHTAGGSLTVAPLRGTELTAGATIVGSWTYYDFFAELSCFAGTGPCGPSGGASGRDFLKEYPGFVKFNLSLSQQISTNLSGLVAVDNASNREVSEPTNTVPVIGRVTMIGLRWRY
jgi:outer membrane receptor protein involved in Fe transport